VTPVPGPGSLRRPLSYDDALVAYLTREDDDWWIELSARTSSPTS
jgi:hypothetical protein